MSNKVNVNRYTPYKQRLFGDLQNFLKCERVCDWTVLRAVAVDAGRAAWLRPGVAPGPYVAPRGSVAAPRGVCVPALLLQWRLAASCLCFTAGCSHSALNFPLLYSLWYLWSVIFEEGYCCNCLGCYTPRLYETTNNQKCCFSLLRWPAVPPSLCLALGIPLPGDTAVLKSGQLITPPESLSIQGTGRGTRLSV